MSIREYARTRYVAYEAVRRQTKQYAKDLEGHLTKTNNGNMLDEYAITFLDGHRKDRTIIVNPSESDLEKELNRLRAELEHAKNELLARQQDVIDLQKTSTKMLEEKARAQLLLEANKTEMKIIEKERDALKDDNKALRENIHDLEENNITLQINKTAMDEELRKFHKTIFGLYRKDN